jgi:hypothetical protein
MTSDAPRLSTDLAEDPLQEDSRGARTTAPSTRVAAWRTAGILLALCGLLLMPLPNDYRALWFGAASDTFHVPLFALLTYLLVQYCWPGQAIAVIGVALAVATGAELIQPLVGRSASWRDLAYGVLGVGMAAAAVQTKLPLAIRLALVALLGIWPVAQAGPVVSDAIHAWRTFPVLADFAAPFATRRWLRNGTTIQPVGELAQMHFDAHPQQGAGAILLPIVRDWTQYERLEVEFSFEGAPLLFLISVRDGKKLPPELPRYDLWKRYPPGRHRVEIDLAELARGGNFPPIELDRVQSLHLVAYDDLPRTVLVWPIRLTGRKPN